MTNCYNMFRYRKVRVLVLFKEAASGFSIHVNKGLIDRRGLKRARGWKKKIALAALIALPSNTPHSHAFHQCLVDPCTISALLHPFLPLSPFPLSRAPPSDNLRDGSIWVQPLPRARQPGSGIDLLRPEAVLITGGKRGGFHLVLTWERLQVV